jgi:uncharacterized protein (TIGR00255 family)
MTGFGRATKDFEKLSVTAEIRSLNSKMADMRMRIPNGYREREGELRKMIQEAADRGKIDFSLDVIYPEGSIDVAINEPLFKAYIRKLSLLASQEGVDAGDLMQTVMRIPNVVLNKEELIEDAEWELAQTVIKEAIQNFNNYRLDEGKSMESELRNGIEVIKQRLAEIAPYESERIVQQRQKLIQQFQDFNINADPNRFEQELIFYLEKLDVNEEKVRLLQHCRYFLEEMDKKEMVKGKKLGFICQEIGREINTIGSKANHAVMQRIVIDMKDELERIKELLLNIL